MTAAPISTTDHAIDRYIERWHPDWTRRHATNELRRAIKFVELVEEEPKSKQAIWRSLNEPGLPLVVSHDGVVKTVLPPGAKRPTR